MVENENLNKQIKVLEKKIEDLKSNFDGFDYDDLMFIVAEYEDEILKLKNQQGNQDIDHKDDNKLTH